MAETALRIFTVVEVMSGVAVETRSFCDLKQARAYFNRIRAGSNLDEDDVQLFEDAIHIPAGQGPGARRSAVSPVKPRSPRGRRSHHRT
mgnify:CR=1 FL=1